MERTDTQAHEAERDPFDEPYQKTLVEIEQAIIAATVLSGTVAAVALAKLTADDFSTEAHRRVFDAARRVRERTGTLDEILLRAELLHDPNLDVSIVLLDAIHEWAGIPSIPNARVWIAAIADASRRRRYATLLACLLDDLRRGRDVDEVDAELSGWLDIGRLRVAA